MDNLRGTFDSDSVGEGQDWDELDDEDSGFESPPLAIGQDERRMQVRAYNHWASLLGDRTYPSIEDLEPHNLDDFGPHSVLLDFSVGIEDPAVQFIGDRLGEECGATDTIEKLSDVPPRSLLSRITDHYMQILANEAPIGFEAEFVNLQGVAILYRGILLPFSSNDETIDFIYGVINWKEIADQVSSDELLLEIDQALESEEPVDEEDEPHKHHADPVTEWADSPPCEDECETAESNDVGPVAELDGDPLAAPVFGAQNDDADDVEDETNIAAFDPGYDSPIDGDDLPLPDFGQYALDDPEEEEDEESDDAGYSFASLSDYLEPPTKKVVDLDADRFDPGEYQPEYGEGEEGPSFGDSESDALSPVDPLEAEAFGAYAFDEDGWETLEGEDEPVAEDDHVSRVDPVEPELAEQPEPADEIALDADDAEVADNADVAHNADVADDVEVANVAEDADDAEVADDTEVAFEDEGDDNETVDEQDEDAEARDIVDLAEFTQIPDAPSLENDFTAYDLAEAEIVEEPGDHDPFDVAPAAWSDEDGGLYDCLALARDLAENARTSEDRSRSALYAAVGRAYDVSLAAEAEPEAYAELLEDNGLVVQDRAPMTPVVKLVFGSDYDKTRITEYATVLSHAHRQKIERGGLEQFLSQAEGGLKGIVATERRLRREEAGIAVEDPQELREKLAQKLRELEALTFDAIAADGAEFSLVMVRRDGEGEVAVIGEIEHDIKLLERAARKLVG